VYRSPAGRLLLFLYSLATKEWLGDGCARRKTPFKDGTHSDEPLQ